MRALQRRARKDFVAQDESGPSDEGPLHLTCVARSKVGSTAEHGLECVGLVGGNDGTDLASEVDDNAGCPYPRRATCRTKHR
jgi:hypothetical protein